MSEKTEQPSARKLADARKRGEFPRSRLFSSALPAFGALAALVATAPGSAARIAAWTSRLLARQDLSPRAALWDALLLVACAVGPALAGAVGGALVAGAGLAGLQLNVGLVAPKLERVNPFAGLKRLFSAERLLEMGKAAALAALLAAVAWSAVRAAAPAVFRAVRLDGGASLEVALEAVAALAMRCAAIAAGLGFADYLLARRRHLKTLMMTREECKKEHKDAEGDAQQKHKRKAIHRQLATGGPARGVHKATAVVVNPTHIAVAIRYDEGECDAPYIVAKAREAEALKLRGEASRSGIPVVRDIPLARSLIHYDVGEEIPEELYRAAAAVLKVALETRPADVRPRKETP